MSNDSTCAPQVSLYHAKRIKYINSNSDNGFTQISIDCEECSMPTVIVLDPKFPDRFNLQQMYCYKCNNYLMYNTAEFESLKIALQTTSALRIISKYGDVVDSGLCSVLCTIGNHVAQVKFTSGYFRNLYAMMSRFKFSIRCNKNCRTTDVDGTLCTEDNAVDNPARDENDDYDLAEADGGDYDKTGGSTNKELTLNSPMSSNSSRDHLIIDISDHHIHHHHHHHHQQLDASNDLQLGENQITQNESDEHISHNSFSNKLCDTKIMESSNGGGEKLVDSSENEAPVPDDSKYDGPNYVVVNIKSHNCETQRQFDESPPGESNNAVDKCVHEEHGEHVVRDEIAAAVLEDLRNDDATDVVADKGPVTNAGDSSVFGDFFNNSHSVQRYILPGAVCTAHSLTDLESLSLWCDKFIDDYVSSDAELILQDSDRNILKKYATCVVKTVRNLHTCMLTLHDGSVSSNETINKCLSIMAVIKNINLQTIQNNTSPVLLCQNKMMRSLLSVDSTSTDNDTRAVNDHGSVDVAAIVCRILFDRPHLKSPMSNLCVDNISDVDECCDDSSGANSLNRKKNTTNTTTAKKASLSSCSVVKGDLLKSNFSILEYISRYLTTDGYYNVMNDYINVKLRMNMENGNDEVHWCKVPYNYVHNFVMNRTCLGFVMYSFLLSVCAKYQLKPAYDTVSYDALVRILECALSEDNISNTQPIVIHDEVLTKKKAKMRKISINQQTSRKGGKQRTLSLPSLNCEPYYDVFLRYTVPMDFFSADDLVNYVVRLKNLNSSSLNVVPWSRVSMINNFKSKLDVVSPRKSAGYVLINNILSTLSDDLSRDVVEDNLRKMLRQFKRSMLVLKCNVSNCVVTMRELINSFEDRFKDTITTNHLSILHKVSKEEILLSPGHRWNSSETTTASKSSLNGRCVTGKKRKKNVTFDLSPDPVIANDSTKEGCDKTDSDADDFEPDSLPFKKKKYKTK